MSKKGVSKLIREALKAGPMTAPELRVALGLSRGQANTALNDMLRAKAPLVAHDGTEPGARRYSLVREPVVMTEAQRIERRRELQRKYSATNRKRAPGVRSRDEYLADMAAQREANADARRLKHNAWKRTKAATAPKPAKPAKPTASAAIAMKLEAQPAAPVLAVEPERVETVEEWMARTGKQVERVPGPWEVRHG